MDQGVLSIRIDDENPLALFVECGAEMHRNRALSDAAFLLCHCDDFSCQASPLSFLDAAEFYLDVIYV